MQPNRAGVRHRAQPLGALWRALERLAGTRRGAAACAVAALAAFAVQSLAWPLYHGRDAENYLVYYLDMWNSRPVYPIVMLYRTPLTGLFFGPLLELFGGVGAEIAAGLLYAVSIVAFSAAALTFGRRAAIVTAILLVLYPPYGAMFHGVATEPVYATGIALWTLFIIRTPRIASTWVFVGHGVSLFLLVLVRPPSQSLVVFALYPLLLTGRSLRRRLAWSGAFVATAGVLVAAWAGYNSLRYGDFVVARTSLGANFPFLRLYTLEHVVRPENGPASRELARAVEQDLLRRQPYRAYGVDVDEFFAQGSSITWSDLIPLSDRTWGWDSDYAKLRAAAVEAIRAHPRLYVHNVLGTVKFELWGQLFLPAQRVQTARRGALPTETILVHGRRLPKPPDGTLIPAAHLDWGASTPDERIRADWSDLRHPKLRFRDPRDAEHARRLASDEAEFERQMPYRDGAPAVASALNAISRIYPRMPFFLVAGAALLLLRRTRGAREVLILVSLALVVLFVVALGQPPTVSFRLPFDPIFILFAVGALLGPASRGRAKAAP